MADYRVLAVVWGLVLVGGAVLGIGSVEAGEDPEKCQPRAVEGGVVCIGENGREEWRHHHPSLWDDDTAYRNRESQAPESFPLLVLEDRVFFGVYGDLMRVDRRDGRVERRVRFPTRIEGLERQGAEGENEVLRVDLDPGDEDEGLTVRHRVGGPVPSQTPWMDPHTPFAAEIDAERPVRVLEEIEEENLRNPNRRLTAGEEVVEQQLARLAARERLDPTNPYYPYVAGLLHHGIGDEQEAARAFRRAADTPGAPWADMMALSTYLEEMNQPEAAEQAYQTGLDRMETVGIDRRRLLTPLTMVMTFKHTAARTDGRGVVRRAVRRDDLEAVDRMSGRIAEVFPHIAHGEVVWRALGDWFAERGRPELRDDWYRRARRNAEVGYQSESETTTRIDRLIWAGVALAIGLAILAFVVGVRGAVVGRGDGEEVDAGSSPFWRPRLRDVIVLLGFFLGLVALPYVLSAELERATKLAKAPIMLQADGLASPRVQTWLAERPETPATRRLKAMAETEQRALVEGRPLPEKEPIAGELHQVARLEAYAGQRKLLGEGRMPDPVQNFEAYGELDTEVTAGALETVNLFVAVGLVSALLTGLWLAGGVAGRWRPKLARRGLWLIPGGPPTLAPVGGIALVVFIGAVLSFTPLGTVLRQITMPSLPIYFGLQDIPFEVARESRLWTWAAIGAVLVVHFAGVFREWRAEDREL